MTVVGVNESEVKMDVQVVNNLRYTDDIDLIVKIVADLQET